MAYRLIGAKPLSEPMLTSYQSNPKEQYSVKLSSKVEHFHSKKCVSNCRLQNSCHFVSTSMWKHIDVWWQRYASINRVTLGSNNRLYLVRHQAISFRHMIILETVAQNDDTAAQVIRCCNKLQRLFSRLMVCQILTERDHWLPPCNILHSTYRAISSLQWRPNGHDSVSNHQHHECLLNRLFRADQRKHQSSASLAYVRGIHRGPVNSPHKWPVTWKMLPFDDVIM